MASLHSTGPTMNRAEFARQIGISTVTISRALKDDKRVRPSTREHVKRLAMEMGYRPNVAARSLREGTTKAVTILLPCRTQGPSLDEQMIRMFQYSAWLIQKIGQQLDARGFRLVFSSLSQTITMDMNSTQLREVISQIATDRVLITGMWPAAARQLNQMRMLSVVVNGPSHGFPAIQRDESKAAEDMVDYLVSKGHRRIAFANYTGEVRNHYRDELWPAGYLKALTRHQLVPVPYSDLPLSTDEHIHRWFKLDDPPTAIIAYDDINGNWFIERLQNQGLKVPEDVSVAAMIDTGHAYTFLRKCTRMKIPQDEMAKQAAKMICELDVNAMDHEPAIIQLTSELFEGDTVRTIS